MKYLLLIFLLFITFSCSPLFIMKELKAKKFMKTTLKENYQEQYKVDFVGTWHEFGRVYGFQFYIVENKENPIALEYYLSDERPFAFDKKTFEAQWLAIKRTIQESEELEKKISQYYPNGKAFSDRIENKDSSFRYVNTIYTAMPLMNNEQTFKALDSLCKTIVSSVEEKEVIYNFYFAKEVDTITYNEDRFAFFAFDNFSRKYTFHYRVDFKKDKDTFEIVNRKLYDDFSEEQKDQLKQSIENWKIQNIDFKDWKLSLLYENNIDREVLHKKFMLENAFKEKRFGYIHVETLQITME